MMSEFVINQNAPVLVELTPGPGEEETSLLDRLKVSPKERAEMSQKALDSALNNIHKMAQWVTTSIKDLAERPSEVEVGFGLTLSSEGNAFIAKVGGQASINVKLKWQREEYKD